MSMQVNKFLLSSSPSGEFILHTEKPRFLAKRNGDMFETIDIYDPITKDMVDQLASLMREMGDWYVQESTRIPYFDEVTPEWVLERMKHKRFTKRRLAGLVNSSEQEVSRWIAGTRSMANTTKAAFYWLLR